MVARRATSAVLGYIATMRLSWNEIRANAAEFAETYKDATRERSETQTFYNDFFAIFGIKRRSVARYEEHVKKHFGKRHGYIDLFWPGMLIVEQKSAGGNLDKAGEQAREYFDALPEGKKPRFILTSDFQNFVLEDLDEEDEKEKACSFKLADLPKHVERFGFIIGTFKRSYKDQDRVNIQAAELMGSLHDRFEENGYTGEKLERLLMRLLFCLFAEDTGLFPRDSFLNLIDICIENKTDFGATLTRVFEVLDTPEGEREAGLSEDFKQFPYVNGGLFAGYLKMPVFTGDMMQTLRNASIYNWSDISPAIFGALFQSVMDKDRRRKLGSHYTTEQNILKTIQPLFLDDLRTEFDRLKAMARRNERKKALLDFQKHLASLTFFDPACGCGNFLVIAYRELRRLEIELLRRIYIEEGDAFLVDDFSLLDINQFYGIEIEEFPARIAETAMWMMDALMNQELSDALHRSYERLPLRESAHIYHGDALEKDWNELLLARDCDYVFGNPPFGGNKQPKTPLAREQIRKIANLGGSGGSLDFVTAWFIKAGEYLKGNHKIKIALVATNSITQGEQVGQLWPILYDRHQLEIIFAHRTFAWESEPNGEAHVHVVIIGLAHQDEVPPQRRLFFYETLKGKPEELSCTAITPDLKDGSDLPNPHLVIKRTSRPLNGFPKMLMGSKPIDKGNYIFTEKGEKGIEDFLKKEPKAAPLLRPYIGADEFLNGKIRYILYLAETEPNVLATLPEVRKRIDAVAKIRKNSKAKSTRDLGDTPTRYHLNTIPSTPFLFVPSLGPESRDYVPMGWLAPPIIPSNLGYAVEEATKPLFALLTSAMHMAWLRAVSGRFGNSPRYTPGLVYNTFPLPNTLGKFGNEETQKKLAHLTPLADAVLEARANHKGSTLAQLYDSNLMPPDLRKAHQALDKAVDKLYRRTPFTGEVDRRDLLLKLYEQQQSARLIATAKPKRARRRRLKS